MRIVHFNCGAPYYAKLPFQYDLHQIHIVNELRDAGHEVLSVDPAAILNRFDTAEAYGEVTLAAVRKFQAEGGCDLFFSGAVDDTLDPGTVREISRMGIPTVNLNFDDLSHPYRVRALMPAFDLVWTTVPENMHLIRGYGAKKLIHMPFAANPGAFRPVPVSGEEDRSVVFIGSCYGARFRSVCRLAQAGIPVTAMGQTPFTYYDEGKAPSPLKKALGSKVDGWKRATESLSYASGRDCVRAALYRTVEARMRDIPEKRPHEGPVTYAPGPRFEDMAGIFGRTALSLGSLELASTFVLKKPLLFIRLREFEVPMCGGIHFANASPELMEYFEPDREMLFYASPEEMIDKARFYLDAARDTARGEIRQAARARAERDHSWSVRFDRLVRELGIKSA